MLYQILLYFIKTEKENIMVTLHWVWTTACDKVKCPDAITRVLRRNVR